MLKVSYQVGPNLNIEFEAAGQKDLFEMMAQLQEILKHSCQKCKSKDTGYQFVVREVDGNKFYELKCLASGCGASLGFGSHKKGGTLFPQRKDAEDKFLPNSGWNRWNPETQQRE